MTFVKTNPMIFFIHDASVVGFELSLATGQARVLVVGHVLQNCKGSGVEFHLSYISLEFVHNDSGGTSGAYTHIGLTRRLFYHAFHLCGHR